MRPTHSQQQEGLGWISNNEIIHTIGSEAVHAKHIYYRDVLLDPGQPCAYCSVTGLPLEGTFLTRGPTRHTNRFPFSEQIPVSESPTQIFEEAIYIPFFNNHFGHLLTETIGLSWHAFELRSQLSQSSESEKPLLIIQNRIGDPEGELLEQLQERFKVVFSQDMPGRAVVKRFHAASPTLIFGYGIAERHLREVRAFVERIVGTSVLDELCNCEGEDLVYICRQNLNAELRHLIGEDSLVSYLESQGWEIFHPQEHSLREQLTKYAKSNVIAGNLSSAMHLLMAFGKESRTVQNKLVLGLVGDGIPRTYAMQFELQQIKCDYMPCLKPVDHPKGQTRNLTLIDQVFIEEAETIASLIHSRACLHQSNGG